MSIEAFNWAFKIQGLQPSEKFILVALANRANHHHEAWPSWKTIKLDTGHNRNTIHKGLASLQSKGYLMKVGSTKGRVCIYRIVGIEQENLSTTSTKIGTTQSYPHSPKTGTIHSPKIGTRGSTKIGIQNHNKKPKRNPKGNDVFLSTENLVKTRIEVAVENPSQDLCSQVLFYVKTKPPGEESKWVNVAISLIKDKRWNTPEGWNGVTSASIKDKEEAYFRNKDIQQIEDDKAALNLKREILERGIADQVVPNSVLFRERNTKEPHQPTKGYLKFRESCKAIGL